MTFSQKNQILQTIYTSSINSDAYQIDFLQRFVNYLQMEPVEPQPDLLETSEKLIQLKISQPQKKEESSEPLSPETSPSKRRKKLMNLQSLCEYPTEMMRSESVLMDNFDRIMKNNKIWAKFMVEQDPQFFDSLVHVHQPQYLWIGCSDSRVPANEIVGLKAGEIFVHRNIANQAPPSDINVLAVVQYAVQVLKVTDIMVTGHYGCGGIKAAFKLHDHGPLQSWLSYIRDLRWRYRRELVLPTAEENENLLCEINVKQQVYNIGRIPIVQNAWKNNQHVRIHGLIYNLKDGLLKDLGITLNKLEHLPQEFRIV